VQQREERLPAAGDDRDDAAEHEPAPGGAVPRRRAVAAPPGAATQIYYRIGSQRAATLCRAVCTQIAFEHADEEGALEPAQRLLPRAR
jgi:hypothetical protein